MSRIFKFPNFMKFSEIHSLLFHLEDCGGAKWKVNFLTFLISNGIEICAPSRHPFGTFFFF
jgi:hypothetical protein